MSNNAIKIGQNVVHLVNTQYPHLSTSKMRPLYNNAYCKYSTQDKKISTDYINLNMWYKNFMKKMREARKFRQTYSNLCPKRDAINLLYQLIIDKLGNCSEDAQLAELILRINGFKNACTASLKRGEKEINHDVCLFNVDDSIVKGNVKNNKTVVVDPWLGKVDFINNYFANNSYLLERAVKVLPLGKFGINTFGKFNLSEKIIQECKENYPELLFKKQI
ncbi:MAG: hypothetical protein MJ231_06810 [bacterium]|nr:hypothetical protein [bacterium]